MHATLSGFSQARARRSPSCLPGMETFYASTQHHQPQLPDRCPGRATLLLDPGGAGLLEPEYHRLTPLLYALANPWIGYALVRKSPTCSQDYPFNCHITSLLRLRLCGWPAAKVAASRVGGVFNRRDRATPGQRPGGVRCRSSELSFLTGTWVPLDVSGYFVLPGVFYEQSVNSG